MEIHRPDPDELLRQVQDAESRSRRARLKVFLGAAPGVGKTYAMLQEARVRREAGVEVLVGVAETHGRAETAALLQDLELLPRRELEHRGVALAEFDLDGALRRRPQLVLVDELAHSNAPGARYAKRWQDVLELLDAGIDVYTTVNIQHFDASRDAVARITGVVVRETVPDTVLERADEVELVDIPVEELQARLQEGKVYLPEQARSAVVSFFRKGNLLALREMALRRTADRVDADMRRYMREEGIQQTWPAAERILAAVGADPGSEQVVRATARLATALGGSWLAVHVEGPRGLLFRSAEGAVAQEHLRLAERLGAEVATLQPSGLGLRHDLLAFARACNASRIVVGQPAASRWPPILRPSLAGDLLHSAADLQVQVVPRPARPDPARPKATVAVRPDRWPRIGWACAAVVATSLVGFLLRGHLDLADVAMLYLLCIAVVAARLGRAASLAASLLSVAALDFLFVPPYYTFAVADFRHLGTFAIMFGVGFVIADMAERIRNQARVAQDRERYTAALFQLSAGLAREADPAKIQAQVRAQVEARFSGEAVLLLADPQGGLRSPTDGPALTEPERAVASWALEHRQNAGRGTDTLPGARGLWLPLLGADAPVGVLGLLFKEDRPPLTAAERDLLQALGAQAALALERARMQAERGAAQRRADREQLRNVLLSSVSHDLRTPLGAITGAASTLLEARAPLPEEDRRELLLTIHEEAERLHRLVCNLLDITRLESGTLQVRKEWVPLEEVLGSALARLGAAYAARPLQADLAEALVPADPLLLEQVFVNLLENAAKYSPPGTPVTVSARPERDCMRITVADRGPGVPPAEAERIFEKLYRAAPPGGPPGAGLGLAICRGIVHAHGGEISVGSGGEGARFSFTLPMEGGPPMPVEEEADHG